MSDAVALAEHLLELVKSIAQTPGTTSNGTDEQNLTTWNTKIQIQNVCDQLLLKTMGPAEYTVLLAESCQESQALHFVTSLGIADFVGEGEATLHELSEKAGVDPQFLGVAMSCVVGRGYFEEVGKFGSRVYKNNELSQILRDSTPSTLRDAIGLIGDEGFRATSRLVDAARISGSGKRVPAVNIAFDFDESVFSWMSSPDHAWRGARLGKAMQQLHSVANIHVSEDYPWHDLPHPIVDVGGGIGALEMAIMKSEKNRHLEFIIFDIPKTVENAAKIWNNNPASSQVSFAGGSFMAPTVEEANIPIGKPTYIIRHVLHDWTDADVVTILTLVRKAMPAHGGRLLLVEMLLQPDSSRFVRTTSMQLLALNSGITRTQEEMEALVIKAGFKVSQVKHMRAVDSIIEAVL